MSIFRPGDVKALDREAARIGVTRQSIIKVWLGCMARAEGTLLDTGEQYPNLTFQTVEHGQVQIGD